MRSIIADFELLSLSHEISELKEMANGVHDNLLVRDPHGATFTSNGPRIVGPSVALLDGCALA